MKKLYVGNLSFKATEEQVAAYFRKLEFNPIHSPCCAIASPANLAGSASRKLATTRKLRKQSRR